MTRSRYHIRSFDAKPLLWWNAHRDEIDMSPPYQRRGRLWSESDKAFLIDSILNGFDIPKFYLADFTWGDSPLNQGRLPYAIIDGKQRFEAIFDFFDGRLVLNSDFEFKPDPSLRLGGLGFRDLKSQHARVAEIFEVFSPDVISVYSRDEEPINDLFVRLNRSKALTGAEIRNAMAGPAPQTIREIAKHEFFTESIRFSVKRGQDLNAAAKVLLLEFRDELVETKKRNLDQFVESAAEFSKEEHSLLELAGRQVIDVLDDLASVFLPNDRLLNSAGVVPVYYWFVRSRRSDELPAIREFISRFEELRKENRQRLRDEPESTVIQRDLVEYDNFNRSTNDQASHEGRFRVLTERFEAR